MSKAEARTFIEKKIAENKIAVFSKTYCPYCTMAKESLNKVTKDYFLLEIENLPNCNALQDVLLEMTGARSVPRVFIGGKCIGGGSETKAMYQSGELEKALAAL